MQTDYSAHEDVYQRRKARGDAIVRWGDPTPLIDVLTTVLQKPYVPKSGKLLELGCGGGGANALVGRARL